jgi:hypothetical protein
MESAVESRADPLIAFFAIWQYDGAQFGAVCFSVALADTRAHPARCMSKELRAIGALSGK